VLSRPLNLIILAFIALAIYYALKPKAWEETETKQKHLNEEEQIHDEA
jgi:hypothetical protein